MQSLNPKVLEFVYLDEQADIKHALQLATQIHAFQYRKDGRPYIEHPIDVATILQQNIDQADSNLIAAALLHDGIELGPSSTYEKITKLVNLEVAHIVFTLSDDQKLSSDQRKAQQLKYAQYLSPTAKLIKLADRLSNVRQPRPDWNLEQRAKYVTHTNSLLTLLAGTHQGLERQIQGHLQQAVWLP